MKTKQALINKIDRFYDELKTFTFIYETIDDFLSAPVSKTQVGYFFDHELRRFLTDESEKKHILTVLTINPSQFNADTVHRLLYSPTRPHGRELVDYLNRQAKTVLTETVTLIDHAAKNAFSYDSDDAYDQARNYNRILLIVKGIIEHQYDNQLDRIDFDTLSVPHEQLSEERGDLVKAVKLTCDDVCQFTLGKNIQSSIVNPAIWDALKKLIIASPLSTE